MSAPGAMMVVVAPDSPISDLAAARARLTDLPAPAPLIGRVDELAQLARLSGVASPPGSGAVLVSGDAGVGKTRLLRELGELARDSGWRVVVGHCLDFGDSALPYLPFREALGTLVAEAPVTAEAVVRELPPVTSLMPARRLPADGGSRDGERMDRAELFEAVHAALRQFGSDTPLLIVIEDLHWADRSTRDLLSFLFARQSTVSVSIVASYRSDDLHRRHPLRTTAAEWARLPGVSRLHLGPLSDADVRALIRALHPTPLRESDVSRVVERAEGNAFFAEELVAAAELGPGPLPRDLAALLLVRLDQLDEATRSAVRVASVAGRRVGHELLSRVVGLDPATLDQALRSAVERNVLVPVGDDSYAFRHALLAEAVYDDLLPGEKVRLHAAYVQALAGVDTAGSVAEVARHARAAHDTATAITMSIAAGDDAMAVAGPDEAAQHYEVALELLTELQSTPPGTEPGPGNDPGALVDLTIKASEAAVAAGRSYRAVAMVEDQLRQLAGATPLHRARLLLALATAALQSESNVDALAATTEALQLVPTEPPSRLRARVLSAHAHANADRNRDEDAARWAEQALALAGQLELPDVAASATTTLARLNERAGDPDSSQRALEQIIAEAHTAGDGAAELRALHNLASLYYYEKAQLTDALRLYRLGAERAQSIGRPWAPYGLDSRVLAGLVAYQCGEWDAAESILDVSGQLPPAIAEAALAAAGMSVAAGRGDVQALGLLPHVRPWWEREGMVAILSGGAAIDLHGDHGDLEAAHEVYDDLVACVGELWQQKDFQARIRLSALMLGQLSGQALVLGAAERAVLALWGDELADAAGRAASPARSRPRPRGPEAAAWVARVRAEHLRLRWLTGVDPPSQRDLLGAWEACVAAFERYPHVFELARSQARLAAVLRAVGKTAQARPLVHAARSTAQRLGARPLLAELRALGAAAPAHRERPSRRDEPLTARELEVLALVSQGRSNREIGGQLYISAKTVSVHVSNILAKLGAAGRTEAAAMARRRGLLPD